MKKLIILAVLTLLIIPGFVFADGMPFPRPQQKTFDFTSVKEKQQYATIEVLSNYFEKMNLFLSLTSLDYENHNITVVIPLKSIPQDVTGDKMNSTDFLNKYGFGNVENMIERQSVGGLVKKSAPKIRDALGEYIMLSLISPLYEISKLAFSPFYGGFFGSTAMSAEATKSTAGNYPGVTQIATYHFEDATVDIYSVESGDTLGDFLVDYYDLVLPDNVRETIDVYKNHYVAILNALVGPPSDVSMFKQYAPNTFKEALRYVRSNPDFKFSCYDSYYSYASRVGVSGVPYYSSCTEESIIRQKFSEYITKANNEASLNRVPIQTPTLIQNSGFEQGELFWQDYSGYQYSSTYNSGHSIDRSNYRSGSGSLYVYDRSTTEWVGVCQQVQVIPGRTYTASAWAKIQEGNVGFWLTTSYPSSSSSFGECTYPTTEYLSSREWRNYAISCTPRYSNTMYLCLGTRSTYSTGSGWFDDINVYSQGSSFGVMDSAVVNFFLNTYSNSTKGMELSMTLPIRNSEISYPLGTGVAWSTPIEDTKVLVKMDKSLDVSFANVQNSVIDDEKRYYLWSYKNWNPDFDIKGTVGPSGFLTTLGDVGKMILQGLNENSLAFSIIIMIIIVIIAGLIVRFKGRGDKKRKTFFMLLTILVAPFISIWAVILLAYGLKTKPNKDEMRENFMNTLIFLGILILAWIFMEVISIIIGV